MIDNRYGLAANLFFLIGNVIIGLWVAIMLFLALGCSEWAIDRINGFPASESSYRHEHPSKE